MINEEELERKIEEYTTQGDCPHYDENASVCDDGQCGCFECISRIRRCEEKINEHDKSKVMENEKLNKDGKATIELMIADGIISQECAEKYFPELKEENEDEKIRKHLIKHFENKSKENWNDVPVKNILAYLKNKVSRSPLGVKKMKNFSKPHYGI